MSIFLLLLIFLIFTGVEFAPIGGFNHSYLDKKNTTVVNGIFTILVIFKHYSQYINFGGINNKAYLVLRNYMGQMIVAMFLFYSGYGMMEVYKRRGKQYIPKGVITKFWKLLLKADIAVILYLILDIVLKIKFPLKRIVASFFFWDSVGNSYWYVFSILSLYLLIVIAFFIGGNLGKKYSDILSILILCFLTVVTVYLEKRIGRPDYVYNTMILLPTGFLYSYFKEHINRITMHSSLSFSLIVVIVTGVHIYSYIHKSTGGLVIYSIWAISFVALVVLTTMKVNLSNPVLEWFGTYIFGVFILQRLPMIFLKRAGYMDKHNYICLIIVFVVTIPMTFIFEKATDKLIEKIR